MKSDNFFGELKRRNVYKVAVAYAVAGWALAQGIAQVFPVFDIPNWAVRLIVLAIVIGFPIALVIAWAFELTPEGLKRTEDVDPATQTRTKPHAWIYILIVGALLSISLFFLGRFTASTKQNGANEVRAKSIAVLPFQNLSEDKSNAFFAVGRQEQILFSARINRARSYKLLRLNIELIREQIRRGRLCHCRFFTRRDLGPQLVGDRAGYLALNCENVCDRAIVVLGPLVRVSPCIDQLRADAHRFTDSLDGAFQDMSDSELPGNIAKVMRPGAPILHHARATDHFEVSDLGKVGENLILHTNGKESIRFILAQILKRQDSDRFCQNFICAALFCGCSETSEKEQTDR
jgi:hypothetical protein